MMKIRRAFLAGLGVLTIVFSNTIVLAEDAPDLSVLSKPELESFQSELEAEIKNSHELTGSEDIVKDALTEYVNQYFEEKNCEVDWPWFDYTYTRDWNFYTVETEISYKNKDDKQDKGKAAVYAEYQLDAIDTPQLGYLKMGDEVIVDNRADLPEHKWDGSGIDRILSSTTGINIYNLEKEELEAMISDVKAEIEEAHTPKSVVSDLVFAMVKYQIADKYSDVEWSGKSVFGEGNEYTCDWDFYTLKSHFSYKNEDNDKKKADLYAEAYPYEDDYRIVYLKVENDELLDYRESLPESLYKVATKTGKDPVDTETEAVTEAETEPVTEAVSEQNTETEMDTETETAAETQSESESETEPVTEAMAETESESEEVTAEAETETEASEAETELKVPDVVPFEMNPDLLRLKFHDQLEQN